MKKTPIELSDFESLSEISRSIALEFQKQYPKDSEGAKEMGEEEFEFPVRWNTKIQNRSFEWVISEMGSLTLRLGADSSLSKNPPAIFYASLGKYETGDFLWEDIEGNAIPISGEKGQTLILEKVNLYLESI